MKGPRTGQREQGSATVWVLALSGVVAVVGVAAVLVGVLVGARHRATAAAGFAALAAATQAVQGLADGCPRAPRSPRRTVPELTACTIRPDGVAQVAVSVPVIGSSASIPPPRRPGPVPPLRTVRQRAVSSPGSSSGPSAAASSSRTTSRTRTARLVEGVVSVAALGRLNAGRAAALALAAGHRRPGGLQPAPQHAEAARRW